MVGPLDPRTFAAFMTGLALAAADVRERWRAWVRAADWPEVRRVVESVARVPVHRRAERLGLLVLLPGRAP